MINAKELDNETSYTYFGARYYDSELSVWLSVDPMSDKYPSLSPYCYSADNLVVPVDPNGKEKRN
jgi:RHS repeat-associated protein